MNKFICFFNFYDVSSHTKVKDVEFVCAKIWLVNIHRFMDLLLCNFMRKQMHMLQFQSDHSYFNFGKKYSYFIIFKLCRVNYMMNWKLVFFNLNFYESFLTRNFYKSFKLMLYDILQENSDKYVTFKNNAFFMYIKYFLKPFL